jgi:hypothetical protein
MRRRRLHVHDAAALDLGSHAAEAEGAQRRGVLHVQPPLVGGEARRRRHAQRAGMELVALLLLGEGGLAGALALLGESGDGQGEQREQQADVVAAGHAGHLQEKRGAYARARRPVKPWFGHMMGNIVRRL